MYDTLYIIGNGLDKHHGIKSGYKDFHKWLTDNKKLYCKDIEQKFNCSDLWSDLENSMGKYNYETASAQEYNMSNFVAFQYCNGAVGTGFYQSKESREQQWYESIRKGLAEWVKTLRVEKLGNKLPFKRAHSRYLTFNYTKTLEDVYKIPADNVLHIHGTVGDDYCDLQLGHGGDLLKPSYTPDDVNMQEDVADFEIKVAEKTRKIVQSWQKPVQKIIRNNKSFWEALNEVTSVFVFGFSFGNVDLPYITKVAKHVSMIATWRIQYYQREDKERFERLAYECGANSVEMMPTEEYIKM